MPDGRKRKKFSMEYLTTSELSSLIKFEKQTIYNMISAKVLVLGKHFIKPSPRKLLFIRSEIEFWLRERSPDSSIKPLPAKDENKVIKVRPNRNLINI
jgi:predicted DNA-binding transcriptional regulator AlpA